MDDYQITQVAQEEETATLPFCQDAIRRASGAYIVWLLIALLVVIFVYAVPQYSTPEAVIPPALVVYYLICAVHILFRLKGNIRQNILAPDILYILLYTTFHLGYVTLYSFGLLPYDTEVFYFESSIPKAMLVINLGLVGFLFGYEILSINNLRFPPENRVLVPSAGWCTFGILMMITALFMHFGTLAVVGPNVFAQYGYSAVANINKYTTYGWALLWQTSYRVMTFGIVIYTVSSGIRYGKLFASKTALVLFITFLITSILEGDRGSAMLFSMPVLLVKHYFISPIRIRNIAIIFVIVMFIFTAMAVVRTIVYKPAEMIQEYQQQQKSGNVTWYSPFMEMGRSFGVVDITTGAVPSEEPYWKGASWRDAVFHAIPFFQGFAVRQGWARQTPSEWITLTYFGPERAGRGFTIAGEGYLNFGFVGAFVQLALCGIFVRWLTKKFSRRPSAMWGIIMLGCLGQSLMIIRSHFNQAFHIYVQIIFIALVLNLILGNEAAEESDYLAETELSI